MARSNFHRPLLEWKMYAGVGVGSTGTLMLPSTASCEFNLCARHLKLRVISPIILVYLYIQLVSAIWGAVMYWQEKVVFDQWLHMTLFRWSGSYGGKWWWRVEIGMGIC